jgi:hypothetical protein
MSHKARVLRLEHQLASRNHMTEQEAARHLAIALHALRSGTPGEEILLPDLSGTKAGAFLDALREFGRCAV